MVPRRKNRIRRVRAAARREGRVAFWKKRAFPLPPIAYEIPAREDAISLFAVISRATRTTSADAGIREREETERERSGSGAAGDERGETGARVRVYGPVGVRGHNERLASGRERERERAKAREKHRREGGGGGRCRKGARRGEGERARDRAERERKRYPHHGG